MSVTVWPTDGWQPNKIGLEMGAAARVGPGALAATQGQAVVEPLGEEGFPGGEMVASSDGPPVERRSDPVAQIARRVIDRLLEESRRRLRFQVHEATGRIWVQVIDAETNEVVKEIPPERYLDLVARIWELVGLLVDERA